ncbi:MAG: serine protease [Pirellulaceae bacterium]
MDGSKRYSLLLVTLLFVCCCCCQNIEAQTGKDTDLWTWTSDAKHHESIVKIECAGGTGTGVVIAIDESSEKSGGFKGYCLTAWHVVEEDKGEGNIGIEYRNGKKAKHCRVIEHDEAADVALVYIWVPKGVCAAKLATLPVEKGDDLEFVGLGGSSELSCCLRHFSAKASMPSSEQKIFSDVPLLPGDSGGPVFNQKNEVVGIISGGWFWWDGGVTIKQQDSETGSPINATWPARAANVGPIQRMIGNVENAETIFR